ncbi:MAG: hypothetical protein NT062_02790 [Proteobacteria bacterium]|nr:hypothetical protein [Pseudomonadota bacterium]
MPDDPAPPKAPRESQDRIVTFRAPEEIATVVTVDPYELALIFAVQVDELIEKAGARFHIKEQLDRCAMAIAIAVARARHEPVAGDRRRSYRTARRLAVDCVTILDILHRRHSAFAEQLGPCQVVAATLVERLGVLAHA